MTPEQRAAAKARCDALRIENDPFTNGAPWEFIDDMVWAANGDLIAGGEDTAATNAELRFIAHARTDLPMALAALDEKDQEIERLRLGQYAVDTERTAREALDEIGGGTAMTPEELAEIAARTDASANASVALAGDIRTLIAEVRRREEGAVQVGKMVARLNTEMNELQAENEKLHAVLTRRTGQSPLGILDSQD